MGSLKEEFVDVLIIGAGPAGLTLANWFRNSDIQVLLVEKRPQPTLHGQAEGVKSTSVEIFESFGIGHQVWAELYRMEDIAIWVHDESLGGIKRERVLQNKVEELGKPREFMIQQSRCEHHMTQNLIPSKNIRIRRGVRPIALDVSANETQNVDAYPISVRMSGQNGDFNPHDLNITNGFQNVQMVRAKYIIGCDGARSWTRKELGIKLEGDLTDSVFGVMDYIPKTNFPDIRKFTYIRATNGTMMLVPRSNKEARIYIPVESGSDLLDPKDITPEIILEAARKLIAPYSLDMGSCLWSSAYRVGQRVGQFSAHDYRAFLAGDAVHTHSPKAGQGMNTSIQDANNLGWKLRLVLEGKANRSILKTYETERLPVAQDLIAFDRGYLKLFSASSSATEFDDEFTRAAKYTTGMSIRYPPSQCVQLPRGVKDLGPSLLKPDLVPGKRLADVQIVYQADGITTRIHPRLHASGTFRVIIFAGDISQSPQFGRLRRVGVWLADECVGLGKLTNGGSSAQVEVLVVHCAERDRIEFLDLHEVYRPWSEESGYDYWRVFADVESAHEGHGRAYKRLEIDREIGRTVIVRPDGYIGAVMDVDDCDSIRTYFDAFSCTLRGSSEQGKLWVPEARQSR